MDEEREKIIEKAFKIRELANRGIGGEKETAIRKLASYRETHSITDAEMNMLFVSIVNNEWYQNATPEEQSGSFAKWFKKSVTVYNSKPSVFYHKSRTSEVFNEFRHDVGQKYEYGNGYGFCFVYIEDARAYHHFGSENRDRLGVEFKVYLKMVNPYYIYAMLNGLSYGQDGEQYRPVEVDKGLADRIISQGFDSIVIQCETGANTYVVFNSNQIKSITNNGDYGDCNDIFC